MIIRLAVSYHVSYKIHVGVIAGLSQCIFNKANATQRDHHCVKRVRIRSYSGPHFPALRLNTERYSVSLRIQS